MSNLHQTRKLAVIATFINYNCALWFNKNHKREKIYMTILS
jgi:hypothetical protein